MLDIEEASNKKDALEEDIQTLLNNFTTDTGLTISSIDSETLIGPGDQKILLISLEVLL